MCVCSTVQITYITYVHVIWKINYRIILLPPLPSLICEPSRRLGKGGIDDFKNHTFFKDIDWDGIRNVAPPYIPEFSSPTDTCNFDPIDDDEASNRHHYVRKRGSG